MDNLGRMLEVFDLHTYYGDSHVLQGVTLRGASGAVTAVLGRNGAGKTTLCRTLTGLTPARAGRVVFGGVDVTRLRPHRISGAGIGLVPQGRHIFASLTVQEHLAIARRRVPLRRGGPEPLAKAAARQHADRSRWDIPGVFARFPRLAERRHHRGNELSGGEQQMLAIARALVASPACLVMDEPTEGLAPALIAEVGTLIRELAREGTSILLVEQNASFAVEVSDYVHVMSKGTIVHGSEPRALWENHDIRTQWLGLPKH